MKIKNNIIYSFMFTFLLGLLIIWNRFIRIRLPKDINLETINIYYLIIIFILSALVFVYYLLTYLKFIPKPNSKLNKNLDKIQLYLKTKKWYINLYNFIDYNITNGPSNFYNYFYNEIINGSKFKYLKAFIDRTGAKLSGYFFNKPIIPYILMFVIPKIIPWLVLLIEIVYYQHIKYFYKTLLFLLVPLIFRIILYMIEHRAKNSIDFYTTYYDFEIHNEILHIFYKKSEDSEFIEEQDRLAPKAGDNYEFFQYLYNITYQIKYRRDLYNYVLNCVVYGLMTLDFLLQIIIILK